MIFAATVVTMTSRGADSLVLEALTLIGVALARDVAEYFG